MTAFLNVFTFRKNTFCLLMLDCTAHCAMYIYPDWHIDFGWGMPLLIGHDICWEEYWGSYHLICDNRWLLDLYFSLLSEGYHLPDMSLPQNIIRWKEVQAAQLVWGLFFEQLLSKFLFCVKTCAFLNVESTWLRHIRCWLKVSKYKISMTQSSQSLFYNVI